MSLPLYSGIAYEIGLVAISILLGMALLRIACQLLEGWRPSWKNAAVVSAAFTITYKAVWMLAALFPYLALPFQNLVTAALNLLMSSAAICLLTRGPEGQRVGLGRAVLNSLIQTVVALMVGIAWGIVILLVYTLTLI